MGRCYVVKSSEFAAGTIFKLRDLRLEAERLRAHRERLLQQLEDMPRRIADIDQQVANIERKLTAFKGGAP